MARQLTTSISDLVLLLSVIHFVYFVFWENFFAAFGLSIQGVAAGIGVYRFALSRPDFSVTVSHLHILSAEIAVFFFFRSRKQFNIDFPVYYADTVIVFPVGVKLTSFDLQCVESHCHHIHSVCILFDRCAGLPQNGVLVS